MPIAAHGQYRSQANPAGQAIALAGGALGLAYWQYLTLNGNTDSAEVGRMFGGVEYLPIAAVAVRREGSLDTGCQAAVGGGIGLYVLRNFQAEMAHGDNAFPAVRPEFGRAHLLSASLVFVC